MNIPEVQAPGPQDTPLPIAVSYRTATPGLGKELYTQLHDTRLFSIVRRDPEYLFPHVLERAHDLLMCSLTHGQQRSRYMPKPGELLCCASSASTIHRRFARRTWSRSVGQGSTKALVRTYLPSVRCSTSPHSRSSRTILFVSETVMGTRTNQRSIDRTIVVPDTAPKTVPAKAKYDYSSLRAPMSSLRAQPSLVYAARELPRLSRMRPRASATPATIVRYYADAEPVSTDRVDSRSTAGGRQPYLLHTTAVSARTNGEERIVHSLHLPPKKRASERNGMCGKEESTI